MQLGLRDDVARFLGEVFGGAAGDALARGLRFAQRGGDALGDLHAEDFAEHGDEGLLPIRIEAFGHALQAAREIRIARHAHATDGRRVFALEERQLRDQATERAAHAEVGFARHVGRADDQAFAFHADFRGQRGRFDRELDAAAVERLERGARVGIQRERAIERGLERTPGVLAPVEGRAVGGRGGHAVDSSGGARELRPDGAGHRGS